MLSLLVVIPLYSARPALPPPTLSAASAIAIDATTGKVLFEKAAEEPRFPASTTKIMTTLLVMENCRPDETITAPPEVESVPPSSMHLKPGEQIRARDLVYAMMLRSANDGCVAAATHVSGSVPKFADLMNRRAKEIGCTHTHFNNPNGLPDPLHHTSAHDLALIAREAMKLTPFQVVAKTKRFTIERSVNQDDREMVSKNHLLGKDPTADGIKTGYTDAAGHCYVGSATRDGHRIITVVLKSDHWQADHLAILEYGFARYANQELAKPGVSLLDPLVKDGEASRVRLEPVAPVTSTVRSERIGMGLDVKPLFKIPVVAPIERGQVVGEVVVTDPDGFAQRVPVRAMDRVGRPVLGSVESGFSLPVPTIFAVLLILGTQLMRRRSRRWTLYGRSIRF